VTVRSLHDGVDTSTSTGRMVAGILMSIAEYERELVTEVARRAGADHLQGTESDGMSVGPPYIVHGPSIAARPIEDVRDAPLK
jgi:DNA invertase Pin-like site-specific DNA recombinase